MEFLTEYITPIIVAACLLVGYIVKKWVKDVDNKFIPTIVCVLGAILGAVVGGVSLEAIVGGAVSGLASTGLHQMFTKWIENGGNAQA